MFATGNADTPVQPWNDPTKYFIRSSGTGTIQMPSRAIGMDPTKWWGLDRLSASNLVASMEAIDPTDAEVSIGVLSNDFADKNRANLTTLAFQQHGQSYAYLPDSSGETFDKKNVRDGHYPIWGPVHFVAATQNGVPSQAASSLITKFSVHQARPDAGRGQIIEAGFVPAWRDGGRARRRGRPAVVVRAEVRVRLLLRLAGRLALRELSGVPVGERLLGRDPDVQLRLLRSAVA